MVLLKEIYEFLNEIAPFETAMSFDNCGVLIGDTEREIENVIVTLDITKKVIEEAEKKKANLIISHHPVIFEGMKSIEFNSVVATLIKKDINAIAVHTNLDIAELGVNFQLAKCLGLEDIKLVESENECVSIGTLKEEMTEIAFAASVKDRLNCKGVRFTNINKKIKSVVVACGAGGDAIHYAKKLNADALVTGEIKHHQILFGVENNISIFDAGHYKSEDVVINPLVEMLSEKFNNVSFFKSESFTDEIEYI